MDVSEKGVIAGAPLGARLREGLAGGWGIVLGATICGMVTGGLTMWALGIYVQPLEAEFHWTRAEISFGTSITFLIGGITGPFVGIAIDRWGARRPILLGTLLLAAVYIINSQLNTLWEFYLLYALMSFARAWVNYIPFNALIARWFPNRMGSALGVMSLGFSASGLVFVPLVTWLVATFGWRQTFVAGGAIILAVMAPIVLFVLRDPPNQQRGPAPGQAHLPPVARGVTLQEAVRTRTFWLLAVALSAFFGGLTSFTFHSVPFFLSRGFSDSEAAGWVSAVAAVGVFTRVGLGLLTDRIRDLRRFAVVAGVAPALALGVLAASTEPPAMVVFVLLWASGTAIGPLMESVLLVRAFGTASFGTILGALGVAETVGTIIGPWVGGAVFDATGGYTPALLFYAAGFSLTAVAFSLGDFREQQAAA
jgi:predicted MFS family arabinose efflux permease